MLVNILEYKKALVSALVSATTAFYPTSPQTLELTDMWLGILVKLISGAAGIYTFYEIWRKKREGKTAKDGASNQNSKD